MGRNWLYSLAGTCIGKKLAHFGIGTRDKNELARGLKNIGPPNGWKIIPLDVGLPFVKFASEFASKGVAPEYGWISRE